MICSNGLFIFNKLKLKDLYIKFCCIIERAKKFIFKVIKRILCINEEKNAMESFIHLLDNLD